MQIDQGEPGRQRERSVGSFSWWCWRPGLRPAYALLLGAPIALLGLLLVALGLSLLLSSSLHIGAENALFMLLCGLVLLPVPGTLARWGWRDLFIERYMPSQLPTLSAQVVAKRTLVTTRLLRLRHRTIPSTPWYSIALSPLPSADAARPMIFNVRAEQYHQVQEGMQIQITYSPHVHYVYTLRPLQASHTDDTECTTKHFDEC